MSLRSRVLVAIALVLTINAALGAGLAAMRAHAALRSELGVALQGADRSSRNAFRAGEASDRPGLSRLVAAYDGDRHVRAVLLAPGDRVLMASTPFEPVHAAPAWFSALVSPKLDPMVLAAPGGGALRLEPAPQADLADSWLNFGDLLAVLFLACVLGCGLVWLLIGQALRPLADLAASFRLIGAGDYRIRVAERGVSEIAGIGRAFNLMAGQLASMHDRNRLLEEQLLKLQDEERAELARDLHDDIGPYLFAVNVDAAMVAQLAASDQPSGIPARIKAIQASVAHMQARVREILGRLRPARLVELGLEPAVRDLVAFWKSRSPDVDFAVTFAVDESRLSEDVREAAFRVVQEGLSNAVRHGRPAHVVVALSDQGSGELVVQIEDDGAHPPSEPRREPGFGIAGMRERVALAGGELGIVRGERGQGWTVTARLPAGRRRRAARRAAAA
jgi:two-component system sensor histidine kinase UhpB